MAELNQVRDGRKGQAFLMYESGEEISTAGALKKGHFYWITAKADTSGFDANDSVGDTIYISSASKIALKEGDKVQPIKLAFLGYANDKSLSEQQNTNDVTCDKDDTANYISDGITQTSGSINGYNLMLEGDGDEAKALNEIKANFHKIVIEQADGTRTVNPQAQQKFMIMFNWDAKGIQVGEHFSADIVPCLLTQNDKSGAYGSGVSMSLNYQGCDSDEEGRKRMEIQSTYVAPEA